MIDDNKEIYYDFFYNVIDDVFVIYRIIFDLVIVVVNGFIGCKEGYCCI